MTIARYSSLAFHFFITTITENSPKLATFHLSSMEKYACCIGTKIVNRVHVILTIIDNKGMVEKVIKARDIFVGFTWLKGNGECKTNKKCGIHNSLLALILTSLIKWKNNDTVFFIVIRT